MKNKFKFIERGFDSVMVLLPGWASDWRIFGQLDLPYDYLVPQEYFPQTIRTDLLEELDKSSIDKVSILGYSLGAFEGLAFAAEHNSRVDKSILFALRKKYKAAEIQYVKDNLRKNKSAYLNGFYKASFSDKTKMCWFKKELLCDYCEGFELMYLIDTLDHLAKCRVTPEMLQVVNNCSIYHGAEDLIAPVREIKQLCLELKKSITIFDKTGHAVFLEQPDYNYG